MGCRKEKTLEKLIYEHTTLFFADEDAPFIRSAAEAQRIIDSGKCASFATTLRRAMFLADMTDETKAMATRLLRKAEPFAKSGASQKGNYRKHRRRADLLLYSGSPGPGHCKICD